MTGVIDPGGWLERFAGDAEIRARLGEARQIEDMLRIEAAHARALGAVGRVPARLAEAAARAIVALPVDRDRLARAAAVDGMPVPGLVRQLRAAMPDDLAAAVHGGLTSQDVMDSALVLALGDVLALLEARLGGLEAGLIDLADRFGPAPLMARTRMQAALPVTVGHRVGQWRAPLAHHRARLAELRPRLMRLQLGGPVGTRDSFKGDGDAIARAMAAELGLFDAPVSWHTDRGSLAELGGWLSMLSGHLGKMGHDIALMAQQGIDTARLRGGGSSSAMAHKANPVRAELLVTLARFNAVQLAGLHLALDHEQERSGVAWTLEWLILPGMCVATGAGLRAAGQLVADVERLGAAPENGA